jgi:hypothetical protein
VTLSGAVNQVKSRKSKAKAESGRAKQKGLERLFVAAGCSLFAVLMHVLNNALENEQIGVALPGELDAIAIVPLDRATK